MNAPDRKESRAITLRFFAPFGGRDHWEMKVGVLPEDTLLDVFGRLPEKLLGEIREKILDPPYPSFAVAVNGTMIARDDVARFRIKEGDVITLLARLVGG